MSETPQSTQAGPDYDGLDMKPYETAMQTLIGIIAAHGGRLHQQEFDHEFASVYRPFPTTYLTPRSPLLGSPMQGAWSRWLDLVQIMVAAGDRITTEGEPPDVVYTLTGEHHVH